MTTLIFDLPDDLALTPQFPPSGVADELRLAAAIQLHRQGRLSTQDAARVAGLAPAGFVAKLQEQHAPASPAPPELPARVDPTGLVDLIDSISKWPGMYVGRASLSAIGHYLAGYRHALHALGQRDPLDGWMRWVERRFEIHHPAWHWTRILLHVYFTDEAAIRALPELVGDYLRDRAELGVDGIEAKLREALRARYGQDFHEPGETHTRPLGE